MKKVQDYLEIFQKPFNFGLLVAAYLLVAAVILPNVIQSIEELAGHSIEILDLQIFGYSPQRAFDILDNQGKQGRGVYQAAELSADIVYPFIYSIFFANILFFFVKKANLRGKSYEKATFLPFLTLVFDWIENIFIVSILINYEVRPIVLVQIASVFTVLKWLSLGLVLLSFLGLLGVFIKSKLTLIITNLRVKIYYFFSQVIK